MSGKPTDQVSANDDGSGDDRARSPERRLTPGAVLDHGRYRLLSRVGSDDRCHAQLWRAKDGVLGRDVALTVLLGDRADAEVAANARRTMERAMHASTFNHIGVARVLDVVSTSPGDPEGVLGVVIAEWTHGTDLIEFLEQGPPEPGTAARLLQPLAGAVEAAHHAGLVLGTDHPQRIRVTGDGEIRLAFPGPMPRSSSGEDVRGLGAVLYMLLTGRWALPGGPDGVSTAPEGPDGTIVAPRTLQPTVPLELSTVAVRALGSPESHGTTGGVRTGAAVLRVLEQYAEQESAGAAPRSAPASGGSGENEVWNRNDPEPDAGKRKKLLISVGVLAAATLLVLGWLIAGLVGMFTGSSTGGPSVVLQPGQEQPAENRTSTEREQPEQGAQPPAPQPVAVTGVDVFVTEQDRDNRQEADLVLDGDTSTHWATDSYQQQLGTGFKSGIGLILTLRQPTTVTEVVIDSPSAGTRVQVRTASGPSPDFSRTRVIGTGTLQEGTTTVPVKSTEPTSHVLVWISALSEDGDGRYSSRIDEITVNGRPARP